MMRLDQARAINLPCEVRRTGDQAMTAWVYYWARKRVGGAIDAGWLGHMTRAEADSMGASMARSVDFQGRGYSSSTCATTSRAPGGSHRGDSSRPATLATHSRTASSRPARPAPASARGVWLPCASSPQRCSTPATSIARAAGAVRWGASSILGNPMGEQEYLTRERKAWTRAEAKRRIRDARAALAQARAQRGVHHFARIEIVGARRRRRRARRRVRRPRRGRSL